MSNPITDSNIIGSKINWVCFDCGNACKKRTPICCTMHEAECDVCGIKKPVTHARDFGYPDFKGIGRFKDVKSKEA